MDSGNEKPYFNVRETAKMLGVHENTIRNWVTAGTIVSARVSGTAQHRFAREEVLRLQKERGAGTSSVAPTLRTDGPELVTANELNSWAARQDAKGAFPDMMRRLLASTPGISNLHVRAYEGTAGPGWDGTATSAGSTYLPAGSLRFEFGTDANPKSKAQGDYDKRVLALPADKDSLFVFATPRNWAGCTAWAVEREAEARFSGVKAIDAHVLEEWLRATPSVHYWISERLGYRPRDALTMERWWRTFQSRTNIAIPSAFFGAGRTAKADELITLLTSLGDRDTVVAVEAPWREEALAFVFSALEEHPELLHRTILVTNPSAWRRLSESTTPSILVPLFVDDADLRLAIDHGHRVLVAAETDDNVRNARKVVLPKIDRSSALDALKGTVTDERKADAMVALARRSVAALVRSLAIEPRFRTPDWVTTPEHASVLAPLALAGSWTNLEGDIAALEKLTGRTTNDIERLLTSLSGRPDAPFVRSGGLWTLTSPAEAALLLLPTMTPGEITQWKEVVSEVLLEPDPYEGMDTVARLSAGMRGTNPTYSESLKKGLANGLALAAASYSELPPEPPMQDHVSSIVRSLLDKANADLTGSIWARLASSLPLLAEAAPEVFLDAVETDLDRATPVLETMFKDQTSDTMFGSSSPHPSLLWALETLCWSRNHFGQAAMMLGRLATVDPGGRLSNRPIDSLQNVTAGWSPQSGASVDEKLAVVARLMQREPTVGWDLAMGVWPSAHATAMEPSSPTYRDWTPTRQTVSYADWGRFVEELSDLALAAAGDKSSRWNELIPNIDELPPHLRTTVVERLREVAAGQSWSPEERFMVWQTLTEEVESHEEYADAAWAMPRDEVATLREIAATLAPDQDARRFSTLFDWRAHVPNHKVGDEGYGPELQRLQLEALNEVIGQGMEALEVLTLDVKTPSVVGAVLSGIEGSPERELLGWLSSAEPNLRQLAGSFAGSKVRVGGMTWLRHALDVLAPTDSEGRAALMATVPFSREFWTQVPDLGEELELAYWASAQYYQLPPDERADGVHLFVTHDRPWGAAALLVAMLHENQEPEIALVKEALNAVRVAPGRIENPTRASYYLGQLLGYLEERVPDDQELPQFEFLFFDLLHDHRPSGALYRALGKDPRDFVDMVSSMFRGEGEAKRTLTPQEQGYAHLSFSVLRNWRTLPGLADDETIDPHHLTEWVRGARLAFADNGRAAIGDEQIGQILATSPVGTDDVWPHEVVREIIENIGNARIDAGLQMGKTNQRGFTTRGMFDGGAQEHELERHYREMATKIATRWPRTARILRGIADSYQREARRHDAEAERMGDDG